MQGFSNSHFCSPDAHTHTHTHSHTLTHAHTHAHAHTHMRTQTHAHTCTRTHTHMRTHARMHAHTHTRMHAHTRRQELLSAHERISLLLDQLAMARLQSRGSTPLRPSPPDGTDSSHHHTHPRGDAATMGRQSPVKAPSSASSSGGTEGLGFWGTRLNSSGGSVGSSKDLGVSSSGGSSSNHQTPKFGGSSQSMSSTGGGSSTPQRTSSFHGFNQGGCG